MHGHPGHPGPVWKIAKMALFDPCMEFEIFLDQMTSFEVLLKCHSLTLSKKCLRHRPSAYLRDYLNNPSQDFKNSFCLWFLWIFSKAEEGPFFKVQSDRITVCSPFWWPRKFKGIFGDFFPTQMHDWVDKLVRHVFARWSCHISSQKLKSYDFNNFHFWPRALAHAVLVKALIMMIEGEEKYNLDRSF